MAVNCTEGFTNSQFIIIASLRAGTGLVCLLVSLLLMAVIIILKKHLIFTQRLILYLTISTALHQLTVVTQGAVYLPQYDDSIYCMISGYLNQWTSFSIIMAVFLITVNLYLTTVTEYNYGRYSDVIHILLIFLLPLLINLLPFINYSYGPWGPWCWIKAYSDDNCTDNSYGKAFRISLWYVPVAVLMVLLCAVNITIYCKTKIGIQYPVTVDKGHASLQRRKVIKNEVQPLLWYPGIFLFLNIFSLINGIILISHTSDTHTVPWGLEALLTSPSGLLISIAYTLDTGTVKRLRQCSLRGEYNNTLKNRQSIACYPAIQAGSDSILKSMDVSTPYEIFND